ncbi:MAG: hypothetical protein OHK0021_22360 [Bryobacter sp.]
MDCGPSSKIGSTPSAPLFGNSTLAPYRGRGHQSRLIAARLARAASLGLPYCTSDVSPSSRSQRNYLRHRFSLAYSRQTWKKLPA